jgi:Tfp pilus assembly protein FimT
MLAEKKAQPEQLQTERHPHQGSIREGRDNASVFPALDPPKRHNMTTNSIAFDTVVNRTDSAVQFLNKNKNNCKGDQNSNSKGLITFFLGSFQLIVVQAP